jgi:hypothetical protein
MTLLSGTIAMLAAGALIAAASPVPELPVLDWERRSDWISVKDHGAVGDGKADDSEAVQATLNLSRSGVTIYFPAGAYRITHTLILPNVNPKNVQGVRAALAGLTVLGHGRASRLVWDGHSGYPLLQTEGMTGSRIVGLDFEGSRRASVGLYWCSTSTFGTGNRFEHCGFRNFLASGVLFEWHEPTRKRANAETSFENCLFQACGTGISFTSFNHYNYTFDGCEFRNCNVGILGMHGNFYARNSHFEESRISDIQSYNEHGCTVRRCTSLGSQRFLEHFSIVSTMTVEGCTIQSWRDPNGAIQVGGAPVLLFDNTFLNFRIPGSIAKGAVSFQNEQNKVLILSENRIVQLATPVASSDNRDPANENLPLDAQAWAGKATGRVFTIPAGHRRGVALAGDRQFLKSAVAIPSKVFDARRDFGAAADGKTDDTTAIQQTIDAARVQGNGAIAYLPAGRYLVRNTLRLTGGGYYFGGAGIYATTLDWRGPKDAPTLRVTAPDHLTIENIGMGRAPRLTNPPGTEAGPDILQEETAGRSFATYDFVRVSEKDQRRDDPPFAGGLVLRNLGPQETVLMPLVKGNLRFTDCGRATILVPISYYGSVTIEGPAKARGGFLGLQSRFNGGKWDFIVKDNHSLVISDYYNEGSLNGFLLQGNPGDPAGRIVVQGAKLTTSETCFDLRNYEGRIFFGPDQFCHDFEGKVVGSGQRAAELYLLGCTFYHPTLNLALGEFSRLYQLGSWPIGIRRSGKRIEEAAVLTMFADSLPTEKLADLSQALDDLRRLGELDLTLNHPDVAVP